MAEQPVGQIQKPFSLRRHDHPPVAPVEERHVELRLQLLDGGGDGGLGHVKQLRSVGHILEPAHCLEISQLYKIHKNIPLAMRSLDKTFGIYLPLYYRIFL